MMDHNNELMTLYEALFLSAPTHSYTCNVWMLTHPQHSYTCNVWMLTHPQTNRVHIYRYFDVTSLSSC
jgi:hypothetical protein